MTARGILMATCPHCHASAPPNGLCPACGESLALLADDEIPLDARTRLADGPPGSRHDTMNVGTEAAPRGHQGPLVPGRTSEPAITSSAARRRRHGRGLSGVGRRARRRRRAQGDPAGGRRAIPAAAAEIERRFKQELLLARQVTHKNVVRIHDLGEINGIKYITMPYVEGAGPGDASSSATGKLPVARMLTIARAVVVGPRGGARGRRRSSRSEARQHHDRQRRRRDDHGFRHRAIDGRSDAPGTTGGRRTLIAALPASVPSAQTTRSARWSAPSSTWRRNRRGASRSTSAPTSTRSA